METATNIGNILSFLHAIFFLILYQYRNTKNSNIDLYNSVEDEYKFAWRDFIALLDPENQEFTLSKNINSIQRIRDLTRHSLFDFYQIQKISSLTNKVLIWSIIILFIMILIKYFGPQLIEGKTITIIFLSIVPFITFISELCLYLYLLNLDRQNKKFLDKYRNKKYTS